MVVLLCGGVILCVGYRSVSSEREEDGVCDERMCVSYRNITNNREEDGICNERG